MFSNKAGNNIINRAHFKAFKALTNNFNSSYTDHREIANQKTLHETNLEKMATLVYMSLNNLSPNIIKTLFIYKHVNRNL